DVLQKRLRELAFLNSGVRIIFKDQRTGETEEFHYERGLIEFIEHLNRASEVIHSEVIYFKTDVADVQIEVALPYANEYNANLHPMQTTPPPPGAAPSTQGRHQRLTEPRKKSGKKGEMYKPPPPGGGVSREGPPPIAPSRWPEPKFQAKTKNRLNNPEIEGIV